MAKGLCLPVGMAGNIGIRVSRVCLRNHVEPGAAPTHQAQATEEIGKVTIWELLGASFLPRVCSPPKTKKPIGRVARRLTRYYTTLAGSGRFRQYITILWRLMTGVRCRGELSGEPGYLSVARRASDTRLPGRSPRMSGVVFYASRGRIGGCQDHWIYWPLRRRFAGYVTQETGRYSAPCQN